jgi:3-deoxy-D-manno-octulosonic-acid transferase
MPKGFSSLFLRFCQVLILFAIPVFFVVHLRQGASLYRFLERLGLRLGSTRVFPPNHPTIWFHAASLGEVKQIQSLAQRLYQEQKFNILVTTFTHAGAEWVEQNLPFAVHKFAPLDIAPLVNRFVREYDPQQLVIVEGDIWPTLLNTARKNKISTTLLNARSSKSRKRFPKLYAKATSYFDLITCPTASILNEFLSLGIPSARVKLINSLKAAQQSVDEDLANKIRYTANGRKILVMASTHASDETTLLTVLQKLISTPRSDFIIWAPRHMRRIPTISKLLSEIGISFEKRTDLPTSKPRSELLILDTLGELPTAFAVSDAVYLGGGLGNEGGHNPFEPAYFGLPIATGSNVENHQQAFDILMESGSLHFVENADDIFDFFSANHAKNDEIAATSQKHFNSSVTETIKLLSCS